MGSQEERCKMYSDSKSTIQKVLRDNSKNGNTISNFIKNQLILIRSDLCGSNDEVVSKSALDMLQFLINTVPSEYLVSDLVTLLNYHPIKVEHKHEIIVLLKKLILTTINNETFHVTQIVSQWKNQNITRFIDIMEDLFLNELSKQKVHKLFLKNIIPNVMDINTNSEIRNVLLKLSYKLLPTIKISELNSAEVQEFTEEISKNYVKSITTLRDKEYENWHKLWILMVRIYGTNLHNTTDLMNRLLRIVEYAFRNQSCSQRIQGYECWKVLIDNASLNSQYLITNKQIKLLLTPLKAKFSKQEQVLTKRFEVFIHLLEKLQGKAVLCLVEFLEFCFGPVGDNLDKIGQARTVPELWDKSIAVLLELLGHTDKCLESQIKFQSAVINDKNVYKFCKPITNSILESCLLLKNSKFDDNRSTIMHCLWTSFFDILGQVSNSMDDCLNIIEPLMLNTLKQTKDDYVEDAIIPVLLNVIIAGESSLSKNLFLRSYSILEPHLFKKKYERSYDQKSFQNIISRCVLGNERFFNDILRNFEKTESGENINLAMSCDIWLSLSQCILIDVHKNENQSYVLFLLWPVKHLSTITNGQVKNITNAWVKLYKKITENSEANKLAILKGLNKIFIENPLQISNIVAVITLMTKFEAVFTKGYVAKILGLVSRCLNFPTLNQEDNEKLSQIIVEYLNPSLTVYTEDTNEEALSKLCLCVEHILKIRKKFEILDYLINFLTAIQSSLKTVFSKSFSKLLFELYSDQTDLNSSVSKNLQKIMLILDVEKPETKTPKTTPKPIKIVTPTSRTAKIANLAKNNSKPTTSQTELPTVLKLFGKAVDSPIKIKGSQLNNTPLKSKKSASIQSPKPEKKAAPPSIDDESTSQFVAIDTEIKFRPEKLNEHQKEMFKKRREDIPALYQDLSQSQSQDIFNPKNSNSCSNISVNCDKENKSNNSSKDNSPAVSNEENNEVALTKETNKTNQDSSESNESNATAENTTVIEKKEEPQGPSTPRRKRDQLTNEQRKRLKIENEMKRLKMDIVAADQVLSVSGRRSAAVLNKDSLPQTKGKDGEKKDSTANKNRRKTIGALDVERKPVARRSLGVVEELSANEGPKKKGRKSLGKEIVIELNKKVDNNKKGLTNQPKNISLDKAEENKNDKSPPKNTNGIVHEEADHIIPETARIETENVDSDSETKVSNNTELDMSPSLSDVIPETEVVSIIRPRKRNRLSKCETKDEDVISKQELTKTIENSTENKHNPEDISKETINKGKENELSEATAEKRKRINTPDDNEGIDCSVKTDEDSKKCQVTINKNIEIEETQCSQINVKKMDVITPVKNVKVEVNVVKSPLRYRRITPTKVDSKKSSFKSNKTFGQTISNNVQVKTNNISVNHVKISDIQKEEDKLNLETSVTKKVLPEIEPETDDIIESSQEASINITPLCSPRRSFTSHKVSKDEDEESVVNDNLNDTPEEQASGNTSTTETITQTESDPTITNEVDPELKLDLPKKVELTPSQEIISNMDTISLLSDCIQQETPEEPTLSQELVIINGATDQETENASTPVTRRHSLPVSRSETYEDSINKTDDQQSENLSTPISRRHSLPTSPITGTTPTKTSELVNGTLDISPILVKPKIDIDGPKFCYQKFIESAPMEVVSLSPDKRDAIPVKVQDRIINVNFDSPVSHKRRSSLTISPSASRIRKLMSPFKQKQTNLQEEFANANEEEKIDMFKFSKEMPSLNGTPEKSILKKRQLDTPEDGTSPCTKRKRVHFSYPTTTCKKVYLKPLDPKDMKLELISKDQGDEIIDFRDYIHEQHEKDDCLQVYPALQGCMSHIKSLFRHDDVAFNVLLQHNINTVGDLAVLSEMELLDLPLQPPIVVNVFKALDSFNIRQAKPDDEDNEDHRLEIEENMLLKNAPQVIYPNLEKCYDLVENLFRKMENLNISIWRMRLREFGVKLVSDLAVNKEQKLLDLPFKPPVITNIYRALDCYYDRKQSEIDKLDSSTLKIEFDHSENEAVDSIYPKLKECKENVQVILKEKSTKQKWIEKLEANNIKTIGDLAVLNYNKLSELPVENSNVLNVYRALDRFYKNNERKNTAVNTEENSDVVQIPPHRIMETMEDIVKSATEKEGQIVDLAKVFIRFLTRHDIINIFKCSNIELTDILTENDLLQIINHYIKTDLKLIVQILNNAVKAANIESEYIDCLNGIMKKIPLSSIMKDRPLNDIKHCLLGLVPKEEVFNIVIPLINNPVVIEPYLKTLNVVQFGDTVVNCVNKQETEPFIKRLYETYESEILNVIDKKQYLSSLSHDVLTEELCGREAAVVKSCVQSCVLTLANKDSQDDLEDLFKFVASKLSRTRLKDFVVDFIQSNIK